MPVTTRPLTKDERRLLAAAQLNTMDLTPYFAHALFKMQPVAAEGLGTFAVDRGWRLYIDPMTLQEWGPRPAGAVLAHEIGHLLREHADRGLDVGAQNYPDLWNLATDAAINEHLIAAGIPLPGGVTPTNLGLWDNGVEEDYYRALRDRAKSTPAAQPGDNGNEAGCGSGAGAPPADWELDSGDSSAPALSDAAQNIARRQVAEAIEGAATTQPGSVPAALRRWAEQALAPPQVDWRRQLRSAVRRAVTWTKEGQADYTYARPGRRRIPGVITPSMHTPQPTIAVVIDTSGSMQPAHLSAALREVAGITRTTRSRGLTVVSVDTQATVTENVVNPSAINLTGGGGTDMRIGIEAAQAHRNRPDSIVVVTDGFTPWPATPTPQRLIAVIVSPTPKNGPPAPPWATTIHVTTD